MKRDYSKREYFVTEGGVTWHIVAHRNGKGEISLYACEPFDTIAQRRSPVSRREMAFVRSLFRHGQQRPPHLNLDRFEYNDVDAAGDAELPPSVVCLMERLSDKHQCFQCDRVSHIGAIEKVARLSRELLEIGRRLAAIEREIDSMSTPGEAKLRCEESAEKTPELWFDSWGEGPHSYDSVKAWVEKNPNSAKEFHTDGNLTFAKFMEQQEDRSVLTTVQLSSNAMPENAQHKWSYQLAASILALLIACLAVATR